MPHTQTSKTSRLNFRTFFSAFFSFFSYPRHSEYRPLDFSHEGDFLFRPDIYSAKKHWYLKSVLIWLGIIGIAGLFLQWVHIITKLPIVVVISCIITMLYFFLVVFKLRVVSQAASYPLVKISKRELRELDDAKLPVYTVLIPLYREEKVIAQIAKAMMAIDYPTSKIDIIITLEEYDTPTREAIKAAHLPPHFKVLILPNVAPKTKPKALNVAFLKSKGEFLVIYDAEVVPDPDQLKKAYLAFRKFPQIGCFQTRLDHYNANQNSITKLFNAEFSFYYDLFLPGLQYLKYPIPLSGHSVHFRRESVRSVGAWDPYNVAEDCDIGIYLHRAGYTTGIIDSVSLEEATSTVWSWVTQRTRWMKGFMQTSIVHLRQPLRLTSQLGGGHQLIAFLIAVPGTVLINLINIVYWFLFILWMTTHAAFIKELFPSFLLYISVISFVVGNVVFIYLNLVGSYRRRQFSMVKYSLLSPVYWVFLAFATVRGAWQLMTRPYQWEKTKHGTHLNNSHNSLAK